MDGYDPACRLENSAHKSQREGRLAWGRSQKTTQELYPLYWREDAPDFATIKTSCLPYGLGRSYGDSCLNDQATLLQTTWLNHLISFDERSGRLSCEAGVSLGEILQVVTARGWMLPVLPGTQHVTVGGAIANDIHGKNHHHAGTFGCHVLGFELQRSSGERLWCSPKENNQLFCATIGGLGLTGVIVKADIQLKKVSSSRVATEILKMKDLDDFIKHSSDSDKDFEYTVAWVDSSRGGRKLGRGVFFRGRHAGEEYARPAREGRQWNMPFEAPSFLLNPLTIKLFNAAVYYRETLGPSKRVSTYQQFFFPLDSIQNWNRMYGPRGFFQYQMVVPLNEFGAVKTVLETVARGGSSSFLTVLKKFGDIASPGLLSFPMPGYTLTLDFANRGEKTKKMFNQLNDIILNAGGRLYPAKDAAMPAAMFVKSYSNLERFKEFVDPHFSSSFWRRVMAP